MTSRSSTVLGRISILPYCIGTLHALVGRFSHPDVTAETVSRALLSGWICRFGCPQTITTDLEGQFDSQVFHCLAKLCGIHLCRMSPHHPAANGLVERLHRTLKAANICHADEQWTEALPLVLLGIRTAYKDDLHLSAAELVYGELLAPSAPTIEPSAFIQQLRRSMDQLRSNPTARHSYPATFNNKDLKDSTHVFLRQDTIRRALDPPYSVPQKVIARTDKTFKIIVRGRQVTVSSQRRFWTGPGTTSLATPAAHQPNHTALQPQQSHHQFEPHAPIQVFVSAPSLFSAGK